MDLYLQTMRELTVDLRTMTVKQLRAEASAMGISWTGMRKPGLIHCIGLWRGIKLLPPSDAERDMLLQKARDNHVKGCLYMSTAELRAAIERLKHRVAEQIRALDE